MIQRLLELRAEVNDVLGTKKVDSLLVAEWTKLEELSSLLESFATQTDIRQSDAMSLPYGIPALLEIQYHLQTLSQCKSLTKQVIIDLRNRFVSFLNPVALDFSPLTAASCLLNPALASVLLTPDMVAMCDAAKDYIISQVCGCVSDSVTLSLQFTLL